MIEGFNQKDERLLDVIQKYGCLFLSFAYNSPVLYTGENGINRLNTIWKALIDKGYITGDLNKDGDIDDEGESTIIRHTSVAQALGCRVIYDGIHHTPEEIAPANVSFAVGRFHYSYDHFVTVIKTSPHAVVWDSLGHSNTVSKGKLMDIRWYFNLSSKITT